jgi:hypothetical protein
VSLRLRLVAAVAAIAVLALAAVGIATYSILSSTLYHRDDDTLNASQRGFAFVAEHGQTIDCARGPPLPATPGAAPASSPAVRSSRHLLVDRVRRDRDADGRRGQAEVGELSLAFNATSPTSRPGRM